MILIPPNGLLVPIICCDLKFKKLNITLLTIEISSINITLSFSRVLIVFSLSLFSAQYSKPQLAGIVKAECNVLPFILNAALPVGAVFYNFDIIWICACNGIHLPYQRFIQCIGKSTFADSSSST